MLFSNNNLVKVWILGAPNLNNYLCKFHSVNMKSFTLRLKDQKALGVTIV